MRALAVLSLLVAGAAHADPAPASGSDTKLTIGGYVETYYAWNFDDPSNLITNYRGFDDRHSDFTIENTALDVQAARGPVTTHLVLQVGATGSTYYGAEPIWKATGGAGPSGPTFWQYIQQANVAWIAPVGRGLTVDMGIFLSPIGPESIPIKDQWNWSRSDLFFGLPFYHTGARAAYPVGEHGTIQLHLYDGWNSVVDDNVELSPAISYTYNEPDRVLFQVLYFGGVERPTGAPEGRAWRHLLDTYLQLTIASGVQAMVQADAGFERNTFGTSGWAAGAAYARVQPAPWLYLVARGDYFREWIANDAAGSAAPLFWAGVEWVASGTLTADTRPTDNLSVRLEYRHDQAQAPLYFEGQVATDAAGTFIPNASHQDTLTLGVVAWF
jgi:hypothetical protein